MKARFTLNKDTKKQFLAKAAELIGEAPKYMGVPRCSYQIGGYILEKDGTLTWEDEPKAELLLERLCEAGFDCEVAIMPEEEKKPELGQEPSEYGVEISLPREKFSDEALDNLKRLITAKGTLMKRAFECAELEIKVDDEKITFPWFKPGTSLVIKAYTEFVAALGDMAINQKRISAKEKEIVNEKYEFRCFLLRLGFIGDEYKDTRKILLQNLSGSAAFKSGQKGGQA